MADDTFEHTHEAIEATKRNPDDLVKAMRHDLRELEAICKMQRERIQRIEAENAVLKAENAQLKRDWS